MNDINKMKNVPREMEKAIQAIKDAEVLYENDSFEASLSRSYYAAFYGVRALLMTKGLQTKTHAGVAQLFNLHFIRTGLFSADDSLLLSYSETDRIHADYDTDYYFEGSHVHERLEEVKKFIAAVEKHLQENGFLSGSVKPA